MNDFTGLIKNAKENLCIHDKRNPTCFDLDIYAIKTDNCECDNCFYGRDSLANSILELIKELRS